VLQRVAVCCSVLRLLCTLDIDHLRCSVLQRVAVCCSVLQCDAVCCSVLHLRLTINKDQSCVAVMVHMSGSWHTRE